MFKDIVGVVSLVDSETGIPVAMAPMRHKEEGPDGELTCGRTALQDAGSLENQTVTGEALHLDTRTAQHILREDGDYLRRTGGQSHHPGTKPGSEQNAKLTSRWVVSSRDPEDTSPEEYARIIRGHWGVEHCLHWPEDAILREDASRIRNPRIMGNLMLLRNMVLFLHKTSRMQEEPLPAWIEKNQVSPMSLIRTLQCLQPSK